MHEDERDVTHSLTVPKLSRVCACVRVCLGLWLAVAVSWRVGNLSG